MNEVPVRISLNIPANIANSNEALVKSYRFILEILSCVIFNFKNFLLLQIYVGDTIELS